VAITEAEVGLVPLPKARMFAVGHFASVADAVAATEAALALRPAAVEMIDKTILELSRSKHEYRALSQTIEGDPGALLFVTVFADTPEEARAQLDRLDWDAYHTLVAETAAEQEALTKVRKAGLGLLMAASTGARRPLAFVEDTAVAPERLPEYVARFREVLERHGLTAGWYGHCSVGCLHIRPFVDLTAPGGVETMQAVAGEIVDLVAEFDGVNSSEHGDGRARSAFARRIFGDDLYEAMRRVKGLFDPRDRLNPGMMVDGRAIAADLRDPALPPPGPLATRFAFPDGMRAAADRCQRIGACRKTGAGVMCPSYMATRDEDHATRGRANALVKALSAPDPHAAMGAERLHEILDLCLECKACKSECPLGVDMATMKSEFLAHHQEIHGVPLRSRLFGSIRTLNRIGAATAPLSNLAARAAPLVGIARERSLPRFERDTLVRWHRRRAKGTDPVPDVASDHPHAGGLSPGARGEAIFLADCFTTYTEPAVGRAAIELLEAAGWRVRLESAGCCGRASISKGLLDQAHRMASDMVDRLGEAAARGVPIVGCEPSCLLTLREEYLSLLADDPRAEAVARQARLVEELLAEDDALRLSPGAQRVVLHGHCHQKALAGTEATVALLKRIPGAEVIELDAGCCGMAGSFGFEAEHYELSMQIGEMRLFPALRREDAGTLVAATGVSCRQQIAHGVGREARHPVQIVRAAL
jgi:Fe-S oxidoreductase